MFNILGGVIVIIGAIAGYMNNHTFHGALVGIGFGAIGLAIAIFIVNIPLDTLVFGALGAAGGVLLSKTAGWAINQFDNPGLYSIFSNYSVLINITLAYLGCMVAVKKKGELDLLDRNLAVPGKKNKDVKIMDTSALIDGRIFDVAQTGFLSGNILVPRFVLHELQMVADSADSAKRQRGRRGLDVLKKMQELENLNVKIYEREYASIKEVDAKVVELAKELQAKVATTDYNLNKVAVLQGVSVLNINDLASALKSIVLPGDSFTIYLAKEGKEKNQAVGYLDDGTMVVVDEGRPHLGKRANIHVNSILQTSAGRMIFTRYSSAAEQVTEPKGSLPSGSESAGKTAA